MIETKAVLLNKIKLFYPSLVWKTAKYGNVGMDQDVIILENQTVFRFPRKGDSKKIFSGEIKLLQFLAKRLSFSVPNYNLINSKAPFAGYPIITGNGLTIQRFNGFSSLQKKFLAKDVAKFLSELHAVPTELVVDFNVHERFAQPELSRLHRDAKKYIYPNASNKEKIAYESFFGSISAVFSQRISKVLVHGDFSGDHIMISDRGRVVGIIDFADRAFHDAAFDFCFLWDFGRNFIDTVYHHYAGEKLGLVERSKVFAQASAIWNMVQSVKKKDRNYKKCHRKFFSVNNV